LEFWTDFSDYLRKRGQTNIEVFAQDKWHISLSKTNFINIHQLDVILHKAMEKMKSSKKFMISLDMGSWKIFSNENTNRFFFTILVTAGKQRIEDIIKEMDKVLQDFNLETFFKVIC
jgi:hypothetical protein